MHDVPSYPRATATRPRWRLRHLLLTLALTACGAGGGDLGGSTGDPGGGGGGEPGGGGGGTTGGGGGSGGTSGGGYNWNPGGGPPGPNANGQYNLANMSQQAQTRWTRLSVPGAVGRTLPSLCRYAYDGGGEATAVKGRELGPMVTTFHVLADAPSYGARSGRIVAVGAGPSQPFQMSEWITDDATKMAITLHAQRGGVRTALPFRFIETVESSPVVRTDRLFAGPVAGVWGEIFLTHYTRQDVIDLEGRFGWSDPADPNWSTNFESIELTMGEELELYFASRSGFTRVTGGWKLFSNAQRDNGMFPHGMAPHFYGVVLARSDTPATANPPDREVRLQRLIAAREGPLLITGGQSIWEGQWFAFGEVPKVPRGVNGVTEANRAAASFRGYLGGVGAFWDERPLANRWNSGATGSQRPFGATKGTLACTVGDPRFVWEMLYNSTDYGLRTFHHREANGARVLASAHPNLICRNGVPDPRTSRDLLGKSTTRAYSWDMGRSGPDGQHRGQNYMWAAAALSGSWLLQEVARDLLECDLTGRGPNPDPAAPRSLRTQQDLSKIWHILPGTQERENVLTVMGWSLSSWEMGWTGRTVTGPVKPLEDSGPDPRVLCCDLRYFVPWNEALGIMGLLESRALHRNIGRTAVQQRYEALIRPVVKTMLRYGTIRGTDNLLLPLNGVRWLPDGQANLASYYDITRAGASTQQGAGIDLLVGTPGWFDWWSGVVHGALFLLPSTDVEHQIAAEILATRLGPSDLSHAEWMACGWP
ncbi:MAG: hypothetical protein IPK26_17135 [Planctomycetes bacterium]|nr:hypothetical protein [Planctomycetota bacterium]